MSTTFSSKISPKLQNICQSCRHSVLRRRVQALQQQRRSIGDKYLKKAADAKEQWDIQAVEIRAGRKQSMLSLLEERGYISSITGTREQLDDFLTSRRIGAYVGIDPTAASLHVGHLLPLMALFWMYIHGYSAVTLLGGATSQFGDPTGRTTSREALRPAVRKANMAAMHYQLTRLWATVETRTAKLGYKWEWAWRRAVKNNNVWLNRLSIIEFLRLLGSHTRVGPMLGRDSVRNKMEKGDGLSFSELAYPLLQGWDWWHMYEANGIELQIGGADQFGNIVAGLDAVNHIRSTHPDPKIRLDEENARALAHPMGFTTPLLTTASGEKFGKSAGNAIWLSKEMTSVYDQYQFFLRTADADAERFLRYFTFLPIAEISKATAEHEQDPSRRVTQRLLAKEVIHMIHGEEEAKKVIDFSKAIFGQPAASFSGSASAAESASIPRLDPNAPSTNRILNRDAQPITAANAPDMAITLPRSLVSNQPAPRILFAAGLVASRSEGHRLVASKGFYVGGKPGLSASMDDNVSFVPVVSWTPGAVDPFIVDDRLLILRIGKWRVRIVNIVSDAEYDERGLDCPGWREWKQGQRSFADEEQAQREQDEKVERDKKARQGSMRAYTALAGARRS